MRVLWITAGGGSWIFPLLSLLKDYCELGVVFPTPTYNRYKNEVCGVKQYCYDSAKFSMTHSMSPSDAAPYLMVIDEFKPDIIHVHGTEKNIAQIQKYIPNIPVVVSIQGILSGYIPYWNNYLVAKDIAPYRTLKNVLGYGGYDLMRKFFIRGKKEYEEEILTMSKYFFCRTDWDKARITFSNHDARIYQGEELLREVFYQKAHQWNLLHCQRHSIFMPSGFNPIKGLYLAIKAVALLKHSYPDVILYVPGVEAKFIGKTSLKSRIFGEEYLNYCQALVQKNELQEHVVFLNSLSAEEMADYMLRAHLFLSPTAIDNSPNAVGEATMVGMPIVTTPVGGILSMLSDNVSCLFAPAGDEYMLAYKIKQIFDNENLAVRLGNAAYEVAQKRHDKTKTISQYLNAYQDIINRHRL